MPSNARVGLAQKGYRHTAAWLLGLAVVGVAADAGAFCRLKAGSNEADTLGCPSDGIPLEWRQRCISYAVSERTGSSLSRERVVGTVSRSFETWEQVRCDDGEPVGLNMLLLDDPIECLDPEHNKNGPNANSVLFVDDWDMRQNDRHAFALTSVWHNPDTGEILDADMELNDSEMGDLGEYGICPITRPCDPGVIDIQNVVTHEAGHFFGLGHSLVEGSTMFPTSPAGETRKRTLEADDREGICTVYPPNSLPDRCDFEPRGGLTLQCWDDSGGCACSAPGSPAQQGGRMIFAGMAVAIGLWWRRRARAHLKNPDRGFRSAASASARNDDD